MPGSNPGGTTWHMHNTKQRRERFIMCMLIGYPELKLFDRGQKVMLASQLLANHGSSLKPTYEFTIAMRSAVMAFQKKHDLEKTGIIDKKTWKCLKKKHKKC